MDNDPGRFRRYFYHCFPQWIGSQEIGGRPSIDHGVRVLELMFKWGLLLTPEQLVFKGEPYKDEADGSAINVMQRRFCFTELAENELPEHARVFGPIALELDQETLRRMGGLPVIYIPQQLSRRPEDDRLSLLGQTLVYRLFDAYQVLADLAEIRRAVFQADDTTDELTLANGKSGAPFAYPVNLLRHFFDGITYKRQPLDQLARTMTTLSCFFYPTDSIDIYSTSNNIMDERLLYYREREWRIVSGVRFDGLPLDEEVPPEAAFEISSVLNGSRSPYAWGCLYGSAFVTNCTLVRSFRSDSIMNNIRRILVPKGCRPDVKALAVKFDYHGTVDEYRDDN